MMMKFEEIEIINTWECAHIGDRHDDAYETHEPVDDVEITTEARRSPLKTTSNIPEKLQT